MYERTVVPTATYGAKILEYGVDERHKPDVMGIKCLRSKCGVTKNDKWRNNKVARRFDLKEKISYIMDQKSSKWSRHV